MAKIWTKRDSGMSFEEKENFLFKDFLGFREDSKNYAIKELNNVYAMILCAIKNKMKIRVVGDYDVDGQISITNMMLGLEALGAEDIEFYAPKRFTDGYGLSSSIVDNFLGVEAGLLITVDNGIAALDAVDKAKALGWKIIIIDHHLPVIKDNTIIYPNADIIIDPHAKAGTSNFEDYCAAGLTFKLFQYIRYVEKDRRISGTLLDKLQSFAAIGTICDSVKLIEEVGGHFVYDNWLIVKRGLETLVQNQGRTTGLYCLLRSLNLEYKINEDNIGYTLGPVMNAVSRLNDDGAKEVVNLLLRNDNNFAEMDVIANEFKELNNRRKELTALATPAIMEEIEKNNMNNDFPIVICTDDPNLHPGIVGIVAGRLVEEYNTPVILLAKSEVTPDIIHGSARSPEGVSIKELMDKAANHISAENINLKYGGHALAAGISFNKNALDNYRKVIQKNAGIKPDSLNNIYYDYEIFPEQVLTETEITKLHAPYGQGHKKPLYKIPFTLEKNKQDGKYYVIMGQNKNVLKLHGKNIDAINFSGEGIKQFRELNSPNVVILYGVLDENTFQGITKPQINFQYMEK